MQRGEGTLEKIIEGAEKPFLIRYDTGETHKCVAAHACGANLCARVCTSALR